MLGALDKKTVDFENGIDDQGALTELGKKMAMLPVDPIYSRLLILSKDFHCSAEVDDFG